MKFLKYSLLVIAFVAFAIAVGLIGYDNFSDWFNKIFIELLLFVLAFLALGAFIIIYIIELKITDQTNQANEGTDTAINTVQTPSNRVSEKEIELSKKYHLAETYLQEVLHPIACSSGYAEINKDNQHLDLHKNEILAEASKSLASILNIEIPGLAASNPEKTSVEQLEEEKKKLTEQLEQLNSGEEKEKLINDLNELNNQLNKLKVKQAQKQMAELKVWERQVETTLQSQIEQLNKQLKKS